MKAVLLTDLERAVIDRLRQEHPSMQHAVLLTLDLPAPQAVIDYMTRCTREKERAGRLKRDQEKRMQRYRAEGYGQALRISTGKAAPHLQTVRSRPGQIGSGSARQGAAPGADILH